MIYYADLIGKPFRYGGRGPDSFDCYGLLKELYQRDGVEIPDYLSPSDGMRIAALMASQLHLWEETEDRPGAAIYIKLPRNTHVAYSLGDGRFIHCYQQDNGVCVGNVSDWQNRIIGYYRYVG